MVRWDAETLWQAIEPRLAGFTVEIVPEIDSTNTELMRRARAGRVEPVLLVAERQTAGRGRLGRSWHSGPVGEPAAGGTRLEGPASLTFSLGLPLAPASWSGLSLAIGVALAESLFPQVRIKWPNDLWWQDRKLAGVLVETAAAPGLSGDQRLAVIGVGINILPPDAAGLSTPAAWLQELSPGLDAPATLGRVAPALVAMVQAFESGGFAPLRARFQARDALAARTVVLSDGTQGIAQGVGEDGALLVHTSRAMMQITSAEVSVRPQAGS